MSPLVFLNEGPKYYSVVVKISFLQFVDRCGGGEGAVRVFGHGHQVLVTLALLVFDQVRGLARCHRLGMVDAGPEVGEGDPAHIHLKFREHLRPEVCKGLHVGGGGARSGGWGSWGGVPGNIPVPSPTRWFSRWWSGSIVSTPTPKVAVVLFIQSTYKNRLSCGISPFSFNRPKG